MIITHEELKTAGKDLMRIAIKSLPEVSHCFHLVGPSGVDIFVLDADVTNDPRAKAAFTKQLRKRIRDDHVEAVIMLSDTYYAKIPQDPAAQFKAQLAYEMGISVMKGKELGIWDAGEALLVTCAAIDGYGFAIKQTYMRHPDNQDETMLEEYEEQDVVLDGRYGEWFTYGKEEEVSK